MLNLLLSTVQISALELIFSEVENKIEFESAAIQLNKIAENIDSIAMSHHLKLICHLLNSQDKNECQLGRIAFKLLLNDFK